MAIKHWSVSEELDEIIFDYASKAKGVLQTSLKAEAQATAKALRQISPKRPGGGEYAKSWIVTEVKKGYIVNNKKHYQLTHLLENGHAKVNGGRVAPRVHIKPAEEEGKRKLISRLEAEL